VVEEAPYEVLRELSGIEIRKYPSIMLATVHGLDDNDSFSLLFRYITGYNRSRRKIAMTAPVISGERGSEKIPMTVPVVSSTNAFSFVVPSTFTPETIPEPADDRVRIEVVGERELAVIRFRGRAGSSSIDKRVSELKSVLAKNGLETKGEPFLMRYNPPFTPGFLRRNEIGLEIVR
jgi:hypothetical protein